MAENSVATGKCKNCEYAIFCETFGEYKCKLYKKRIYFPDLERSCHVPKKTKEEKQCHCRVCEERAADMVDDE